MRKDALGTSGARRARRHAGDERRGGKILATEEGAPSEHYGVNWATEAHLGVLGGDLEHVVDGGEDVAGVEEEDGPDGAPRRGASWVLLAGSCGPKWNQSTVRFPHPSARMMARLDGGQFHAHWSLQKREPWRRRRRRWGGKGALLGFLAGRPCL